jgi:hypothetical protein
VCVSAEARLSRRLLRMSRRLFATVGDRKLRKRADLGECAGTYRKGQGRYEDDLCHRALPQRTVLGDLPLGAVYRCDKDHDLSSIPSVGGLPRYHSAASIVAGGEGDLPGRRP